MKARPMPWTMGPDNNVVDRDGNGVVFSGLRVISLGYSAQAAANTAALIELTKDAQQDQETIPALRIEGRRWNFSAMFDRWYRIYPRKKAVVNARKAFLKLRPSPELFAQMMSAVKAQADWRARAEKAGVFAEAWKHPATWLNAGCWDDEIPEVKAPPVKLPRNNEDVLTFADENDYSMPAPGQNWADYKVKLIGEIESRQRRMTRGQVQPSEDRNAYVNSKSKRG